MPATRFPAFPSHDAHTVQWAGFKGKKNGDLPRAAEVAGYEVMLTVDQGIPHQTYPAGRERWKRFSPARLSRFHRQTDPTTSNHDTVM